MYLDIIPFYALSCIKNDKYCELNEVKACYV